MTQKGYGMAQTFERFLCCINSLLRLFLWHLWHSTFLAPFAVSVLTSFLRLFSSICSLHSISSYTNANSFNPWASSIAIMWMVPSSKFLEITCLLSNRLPCPTSNLIALLEKYRSPTHLPSSCWQYTHILPSSFFSLLFNKSKTKFPLSLHSNSLYIPHPWKWF